ncbi:MAG: hypothetical protein JSS20_04020 [Proteobacteria bacterium]|nr:hypothetical protein [Pseudomonadota bacterium]
MTDDEIDRRAETAGLKRFRKAYPGQAKAALESAAQLASKLPKDFAPAEEPLHVFSLAPKSGENR